MSTMQSLLRVHTSILMAASLFFCTSQAFSFGQYPAFVARPLRSHRSECVVFASGSNDMPKLEIVPPDDEGVPIPFVDVEASSFIECYADSIATVNGVQYTIGCPCDYAVALTYFDDNDNLVPIELDDELMDDVFPVAERIIMEEFGDELALQRTPQTLTLVGELEEDEEDIEDGEEDGDLDDGEEEVEVLVSFEHRGKEFNLVRLLDPVLLVGKADDEAGERRLLLSPEESDDVMPILEGVFLEYTEERRGEA